MPIQNLGPPSTPPPRTAAAPSPSPSAGGDWQAQLDDFISVYLGTKPLLQQSETFGQVPLDALPEVDPNDPEMQRRSYAPDLRPKGLQGARPSRSVGRMTAVTPPSTSSPARPGEVSPLTPKTTRVEDKAFADGPGNAESVRPMPPGETRLGGRDDVYA
jgi:hypothetical protein